MDLLDVIVLAALAGFAYSGWRRGITWVGLSLLGLVIGVIVATLLAPPAAGFLTKNTAWRPTIAAGIFFATILLIQGVGTALGFRFRLATLRTRFAEWDSILGSLIAGLGVLLATWYLSLTFVQSRWTWVDKQINGSFVVRVLAKLEPTEPQFLAQIQNSISNNAFPNAFAGLNPVGLPDVAIPAPDSTASAGIKAAAANTARIISYIPDVQTCFGAEAGSGFAITPDYLVTNAHVVAAGDHFEVDTPDGNKHTDATVVLFDPDRDVAILHVPGLGMTPLTILENAPLPQTTGAVIGYPGGKQEVIAPAAVRGTEKAQAYNIYGPPHLVQREIVVVAGQVIPGNSGGPLVDGNGSVIGLVFAESTSDPGQEGYALTIPEITPDLKAGNGKTTAVSTQGCSGGG